MSSHLTTNTELIYLDNLATTPTAPEVIEAMCEVLRHEWGNPSSAHALGWRARERVEDARLSLARLLGVRPQRLIFTSGATEASHLALSGALALLSDDELRGARVVSQVSEHSATLGPLRAMSERRDGPELALAPLTQEGPLSGQVDLNAFEALITPNTRLVSLMHVNNELGVIQPLHELIERVRALAHPLCLVHVDGAQAVGKLPVDLSALDADLYSLSAHKFYGPKGAGALCVWPRGERAQLKLPPVLFGGGQERGLRPGTLATHQLVGLGVAARLTQERLTQDIEHSSALSKTLFNTLCERGARLNALAPRVSGALNVRCDEPLFERLSEGWSGRVAYSRGSACQSASGAPSHVLRALGLSPQEASLSVRLCVGRYTTKEEVARALKAL